jgi:hypothetical protein
VQVGVLLIMTPEGSPGQHLQQSTSGTVLQPTFQGNFTPVVYNLQHSLNQFQSSPAQLLANPGQLQYTTNQIQVNNSQLQSALTQVPYLQASNLPPTGGSTYVYQLVGTPQPLVTGQPIPPASVPVSAASSTQFSLVSFPSVFPFGTAAGATVVGGQHIKAENNGAAVQLAFSPTNQLQPFAAQPQLVSLQPQQLQFQPMGAQQQLLCSPPIFATMPANTLQPALTAAQPVQQRQKKSAKKSPAAKKKSGASLKQPEMEATKMPLTEKSLPDHVCEGLDIIFVVRVSAEGTADKGRNFDGLAEFDFSRLLLTSGLVAGGGEALFSPTVPGINGPRLLKSGIGLLSAKDTTEPDDAQVIAPDSVTALRAQLTRLCPKVVVFHGKALYEAVNTSGKLTSDRRLSPVTHFGHQPHVVEGTTIAQWILPAGSDKCTGWLLGDPDRLLPCYRSLKRFVDHVKGLGPRPSESDCKFSLTSLAVSPRKVRKEEFILKKKEVKAANKREEAPSTSILCAQQVTIYNLDLQADYSYIANIKGFMLWLW